MNAEIGMRNVECGMWNVECGFGIGDIEFAIKKLFDHNFFLPQGMAGLNLRFYSLKFI
jgi:hypothetical protein